MGLRVPILARLEPALLMRILACRVLETLGNRAHGVVLAAHEFRNIKDQALRDFAMEIHSVTCGLKVSNELLQDFGSYR